MQDNLEGGADPASAGVAVLQEDFSKIVRMFYQNIQYFESST